MTFVKPRNADPLVAADEDSVSMPVVNSETDTLIVNRVADFGGVPCTSTEEDRKATTEAVHAAINRMVVAHNNEVCLLRTELERAKRELHRHYTSESEKNVIKAERDKALADLAAVVSEIQAGEQVISTTTESVQMVREIKAELSAITERAERAEMALKRYEPVNTFNGMTIDQWKDQAERGKALRLFTLQDKERVVADADAARAEADKLACRLKELSDWVKQVVSVASTTGGVTIVGSAVTDLKASCEAADAALAEKGDGGCGTKNGEKP